MTVDEIEPLCDQFRERAEAVDQSGEPPLSNFEALARAGYYRFVKDADGPSRRRLMDRLSSACGVTAFLSSQHSGSCRRLFKAQHPLWKQAVNGDLWFGVCFAHLRRPVSPVTLRREGDDLVYEGHGPWFSGEGMMDHLIVGGATEDGRFLMAQCPRRSAGIQPGQPARLAVMNATATVPLSFHKLRIPATELVVDTDAAEMNQADMHSTVYQSSRSLGVARGAARFLPETARQQVEASLERQHQEMDQWEQAPSWPEAGRLRVRAIKTAGEVVQAAFVSVGGRSHSLSHPIQRLAREASFYSTTQLTQELKNAYLEQMV